MEKKNDEIQKKDFEIKRLQSELNKTSASLMKAQMQAEVYYSNTRRLLLGGGGGSTYLYDIIVSLSLSLCLQYYTSEMMDDSYLTSGQEPLRARDPAEMPYPPPPNQGAGGQYQMHAPRH